MSRPLKLLMVEDNPADAELILRELRRAGFEPDGRRVETESDFLAGLEPGLDIILSDYALPEFSGPRALDVYRASGFEIPFIIISGTIGEDAAVAAMKQGANDYLLKDRLGRLGLAVEQALDKERLRRERNHAEAVRRETEESLRLFRTLVDQSSDVFEVIDPESGRFLDVSANGPAELGFTREELLSMRVFDIDSTVDPAAWPQLMEVLRRAGSARGEGCHRRKDGTTFPVEFNSRLVRLDREYVVGTVRDITGRKQAEARLREQAEMLDHAHDAIIVRDIHTRCITFWNQGAERLYGWTAAEALGRNIAELIFDDPNALDSTSGQLLKTGEWHGECHHITKDRKAVIVSGNVTLVRDSHGAPKSALVINIDITEQKKLEAQFLRAQRMEGIGTLASGVAHDLNNILCPIMMCVPMLRGELKPGLRDDIISVIETNARRGADIVKQVLTFARGAEGKRVIVQPVHLVKEMATIARQTFSKSIAVEARYPEEVWPVECDPTQIHQVLLNLCINARDAMPNGGELIIALENFTVDEQYAGMTPGATPGPHVVIAVSDTGTGIPAEIVDKIFDPFFTTKEIGKGTGLGLSTLVGIVKGHGGFVAVESQVGRGTTFKVFLPSARAGDSAALPAEPDSLSLGKGELILVVDDEPSFLQITRNILEKHGYRVFTATDGTDGLIVFVRHSRDIKAVLTDLAMPSMDGAGLTRALKKTSPHTPVIMSTGVHCDPARESELRDLGIKALLRKPYNASKLLTVLRTVLDGHPVVES